jgi:hypothetical protein
LRAVAGWLGLAGTRGQAPVEGAERRSRCERDSSAAAQDNGGARSLYTNRAGLAVLLLLLDLVTTNPRGLALVPSQDPRTLPSLPVKSQALKLDSNVGADSFPFACGPHDQQLCFWTDEDVLKGRSGVGAIASRDAANVGAIARDANSRED